jgi:hypothetical protein
MNQGSSSPSARVERLRCTSWQRSSGAGGMSMLPEPGCGREASWRYATALSSVRGRISAEPTGARAAAVRRCRG